ncbi:MAG: lipopolysaccharide biosynthesis protein RfbH [Verrucomicrobiota bacterium]|nr:lipopolysaccharide biosynthesis protein RfbH [Verrucomicrobiota bacterium]
MKTADELKAEILRLTREFSRLKHTSNGPGYRDTVGVERAPFTPGETVVPYAGRVFTADEVEAAVSSTLDFWLTLGPEGEAFEAELAHFLGLKRSLLVNSGSSANLVALSALTSPKLGERQLRPGDEVITVAAGFPTTVAPILQNGLVPVFIDNDPLTLNGRTDLLEEAFTPGKTKAVMMAHTLGNPFDLSAVTDFCRQHNLWLIEDNCDALGCRYDNQLTGTFGDLSTQSFYPPHHLTMGEGGAVNIVRNMQLKVLVESFRDWGRDCWCASGKDNTCNKRFGWQLGELPLGYDHKYIYSHLGYNLKPLDPQAAIGRQQLKKLPDFVRARADNWKTLRHGLAHLKELFDFHLPTHATSWSAADGFEWDATGHRTDCSWFGFMLLVKPTAPFSRTDFARHLNERKIGNRMLFGGNLLRQPAFVHLRKTRPEALRICGSMHGADRIMNESIFVGVYPGLTPEMLGYIIETISSFCRKQ